MKYSIDDLLVLCTGIHHFPAIVVGVNDKYIVLELERGKLLLHKKNYKDFQIFNIGNLKIIDNLNVLRDAHGIRSTFIQKEYFKRQPQKEIAFQKFKDVFTECFFETLGEHFKSKRGD